MKGLMNFKLGQNSHDTLSDKLINEQASTEKILKGSTDKTRIKNLETLTKKGLKGTEENFKGEWSVSGQDLIETLKNIMNLSLFKLTNSEQNDNDYISFKHEPFVIENGKKIKGSGSPKITELDGSGSKTFNVNYKDGDGVFWQLTEIKARNNGLLALGRALKDTTKGVYPNKITITMGTEDTRERDELFIDVNQDKQLQNTFNSISTIIASYILTSLGVKTTKDPTSLAKSTIGKDKNYISNLIYSYIIGRVVNMVDDEKWKENSKKESQNMDQTILSNISQSLEKIYGIEKNLNTLNNLKNMGQFQKLYDSNESVSNLENILIDLYVKLFKKIYGIMVPDSDKQFDLSPKVNLIVGRKVFQALKGADEREASVTQSGEYKKEKEEFERGD